MSFNSIVNELEDLREQFHNWKQTNPQKRIPTRLWDHALDLLSKHSLDDIAKSIGSSPSYIRRKQKQKSATVAPELKFVEVQPNLATLGVSQAIQVNIQDHKGIVAQISFQGSIDQIFPLITTLFKEGKPCSK